jgi:NMD protein affecting ribosome stability and mRNA decay
MSVKQNTERYSERPKLKDPYLLSKAYPEPTICPTCGLVYHKKRWVRDENLLQSVSTTAEKHKCPACRKIEEHYVMGLVSITGTFFPTIKNEIINIIHNQEKKEIIRNPLARIISLNNKDNTIMVETTNDNLAIAIGKALERSHGGELNINYASNEQFARVNWHRDLEVGSKPTHK